MKQRGNTSLVIVCLLVAAVIGFIWYRKHHHSILLPPPTPEKPGAKAPPPDANPLERDLEIRMVSISGDALPVGVVPKASCGLTTLDAIKLDMEHSSPSARLLFTLEPIDPSDRSKGSAQVTSLRELKQGKGKTFELGDKKVALLGLYVCKDNAQTGSCRQKKVANIFEIFNLYVAPRRDAPKDAPDRIYFFQFFVRIGKTLVIVGKKNLSSFNYNEFKRYIGHLLPPQSPPPPMGEAFKTIQKISATIASPPLQVEGNELRAAIPYVDYAHCGSPPSAEAQSATKPPQRKLPRLTKPGH